MYLPKLWEEFDSLYHRTADSPTQDDGPTARCLAVQVLGDVQPGSPGGSSICYTAQR
jgi:hypothetical protein